MAVTADLRVKFAARQTGAHDMGGPSFAPVVEKILQFGSGTTANNADIVWADNRTLAASATEDLDLAGVLADAFGATVAMAEVVAILVVAAPTNTNDVVLGAATQAVPLFGGTAGTFAVKPGGFFFVAAPGAAGQLSVGAGATDDLKVANSGAGTEVSYQIAILGRSA
ncbi:MAG: hypothetical protein KA745_00235 [Gemmatimonadales bacterium]|nr:hypothetical protein [Gemmatimonadales bacterium]